MAEYRFEHPPVFPGGRVVIQATNAGAVAHSFTLVRVPDDLDVSLSELGSGIRRFVFPTVARGFDRPPGGGTTLAADLGPGRYVFFCFTEDPDGLQHLRKGMLSEFHVRSETGGTMVAGAR